MKRAASIILLLTVAACGGDNVSTKVKNPTPSAARPRSTGTITILQPASGALVKGPTMKVKVSVTGARVLLASEVSRDIKPDTGHVHLALDGKTVTLLAGLEYEIKDLTPGSHILQAEFAAADHGPFNPRVLATATFTVQ